MKNRVTDSKDEANVLFLQRDGHLYVFSYRDDQSVEIRRTVGCMAANPELNFTWGDGNTICTKVRELDWKSNAKPNL